MQYAVSDDEFAPVYYGNTLKPTHAKNAPEVTFDAKKKLVAGQVRITYIIVCVVFEHLFNSFQQICSLKETLYGH